VASCSVTGSKRLRVLACVLVLLTCMSAIGATCAVCVTGHPAQALEQTLVSPPVVTAPPEMSWGGLALFLGLASLVLVRPRVLTLGRASPAELQRFRL